MTPDVEREMVKRGEKKQLIITAERNTSCITIYTYIYTDVRARNYTYI